MMVDKIIASIFSKKKQINFLYLVVFFILFVFSSSFASDQSDFFYEHDDCEFNKLRDRYFMIRDLSDTQGIDSDVISEIKENFFDFDHHKIEWIASESFWKPTGLVLGYPFSDELVEVMDQMRYCVFCSLGLGRRDYWVLPPDFLHITVMSYSHYSERGKDGVRVSFPVKELPKAKKIIAGFNSVSVTFEGLVLTSSGALLLKGFVDNDDLFSLREALKMEIDGITQKSPNIIHVKLAQILTELPQWKVKEINRIYGDVFVGRYNFQYVTSCYGNKIFFKR